MPKLLGKGKKLVKLILIILLLAFSAAIGIYQVIVGIQYNKLTAFCAGMVIVIGNCLFYLAQGTGYL